LNNLGIFQSLKLRKLIGKILGILLKLNCTPNPLGCNGLRETTDRIEKVMIFEKIRSAFVLAITSRVGELTAFYQL